jgi:hypothetical protein
MGSEIAEGFDLNIDGDSKGENSATDIYMEEIFILATY